MLAELDVDAAVAEAELLEAVGGAEVGLVLGLEPGLGARLEAQEGVLVVEGNGGGGDGVAEEARGQVRADLEGLGGVFGGGGVAQVGARAGCSPVEEQVAARAGPLEPSEDARSRATAAAC